MFATEIDERVHTVPSARPALLLYSPGPPSWDREGAPRPPPRLLTVPQSRLPERNP